MTESATANPTPMLNNSLYDKLKFLALIVLPAFATFIFAVAEIWEIDGAIKIAGTIVAGDTFLGALLRLSTKRYYKSGKNFDGDVVVTPEDGGNKVSIAFDRAPEDVVDEPGKHSLEFKIKRVGFE